MASRHSYTITLKNNHTEREGIEYLLNADKHFYLPDTTQKKEILLALGEDEKRHRTFDLVLLKKTAREGEKVDLKDATLVELKTTQKKLDNNPHGFFFGATKNEFDMAERLGDKYIFCFVCLHPDKKSHAFLTLDELNHMINTKRIQYQINLEK